MSRRIVKLFQPWKARKVESGYSCTTIRPIPKRPQDMPNPGDILDAREWTGRPRHSNQRKIGEFEIEEVRKCTVSKSGVSIQGWGHYDWANWCIRLTEIAQSDGFLCWSEMRDWFDNEHGLPFTGIFIKWRVNRCHTCKKVINAGATCCPHCLAIDAES